MVTTARRLGASPAQLAVLVACLGLAAYAGFFLLGDPALLRMLIWFAGAAVVHDVVLFPLYAAVDRLLVVAARGRVPLMNHIRVPALAAGLMLLMFWPGIVRQGEPRTWPPRASTRRPTSAAGWRCRRCCSPCPV